MPYKVSLTLLGGQRTQRTEICREPTPKVGNIILVSLGNVSVKAQVMAVRTYPSKSPGIAVETVDDVDAQEM